MLVYNESIDLNSKIRFIRVPCGSELTSHSQSRTQTVSILCIWPILKRLYFIFHRGYAARSPFIIRNVNTLATGYGYMVWVIFTLYELF